MGWKRTGTVDSLLFREQVATNKREFESAFYKQLLDERRAFDNMLSDVYQAASRQAGETGKGTEATQTNVPDDPNAPTFYVTEEQLQQIFPGGDKAVLKQLQAQLQQNMRKYGIVNEIQLAHFLAQAGHETGGFTKGTNVENLNYRSADRLRKIFPKYFKKGARDPEDYVKNPQDLANYVYSSRMGNGAETTGDGYKYRGRGVFQLTGKNNYSSFNDFYHQKHNDTLNFVDNPDLIATDTGLSVESALWFFQMRVNVTDITLLTSVKEVTRKVNGGENGLSDRERIFAKALLYLVFLPKGIAKVD
ncbi:glycoside hydrolase family 19 protein [Fibrella arboris]|uniref:glycoside hydrolase family 19 protein n=1 Tax=Fibrella arboris TaxID=3242486 RepID=UPI003522B6DF